MTNEQVEAARRAVFQKFGSDLIPEVAEFHARFIEAAATAPLLERIAELEAKLAQRVPDGWKLVPVEPTKAMLDAMLSSAWLPGCYRELLSAAPAAPEQQEPTKRCPNCDDTGDVHGIDGEWRGVCHCPAGQAINEQVKPSTNSIVQAAVIRALDEASVRNEVLRGMCLEVALEKARDMLEGLK